MWGMRTLIVSVLSLVDVRVLWGGFWEGGAFARAVVDGDAAVICRLSEWDDFLERKARIGEMV